MGKEVLTLCDVSKYYTSGQSVVMGLNRVNLTFRLGEFVAITGESGSGKSTLAKVMAGILPYESGEMLLCGSPTSHYDGSDWERYRSDAISFISQSYDILPGCTVQGNVVSALRLTGMGEGEAAVRAEEILREVELWHHRRRRAAKLSSGQKQRLSIARALAKPAPILIADEPTGNLDAENSAKIVALLSAAAKERLVVMITHEFDEAADCATRRIAIQDGVVASDTALRPASECEELPAVRRSAPRGLSTYTAGLQIVSRPVWSSIMLTFFALTAFAVFAFFGTFAVNLDDTSTRIYDNSAFRNGSKDRIVVVRGDGEHLTDEDLSALLTMPHVESVERYGLITDVNYFYREGVDYIAHYSAQGGSATEDATGVSCQVTLENHTLYMKTVPLQSEVGEFLTAGRMPENMFEVVAGNKSLLGKTIPVYIQDVKNWGRTSYLTLEMTVVGLTNAGPHLYFDEQLGETLSSYMLHGGALIFPGSGEETNGGILFSEEIYGLWADAIAEAQEGLVYRVSSGSWKNWLLSYSYEGMAFRCWGGQDPMIVFMPTGAHSYSFLNAVVVPEENYAIMVDRNYSTQMCLTLEDYAYTDETMKTLREMGYGALSPYRAGSTSREDIPAAERMQTLKVCLLALAAVVALQIVVLRAMFSMEMEEYRLLANLGLRWKNAGRSIFWQIGAFSLGGEVLAAVAVLIAWSMNVKRVTAVLRGMPWIYMLLIWGIHFAAALLAAVWVVRALRRQVYPVTGMKADLMMDEEVEA